MFVALNMRDQLSLKAVRSLAAMPLDQLIARARASDIINEADPALRSANFPETVTGRKLILIEARKLGLPQRFVLQEAVAAMSKKHLHPANAWEASLYMNAGWDGRVRVTALGSVWKNDRQVTCVPELWWSGVGRWFALRPTHHNFRDTDYLLVTRK